MPSGPTGSVRRSSRPSRPPGSTTPGPTRHCAAEHALDGDSVVVATGTASGKSLAYLAPVLSALLDGSEAPNGRGATALYLAPTKALAADQRRAVKELSQPLGNAVRPAVYDGDTPVEEREWVRQYANYVLTNPDMLHRGHPARPTPAGPPSCGRCSYVVIDECHTYRGRLRLPRRPGAAPAAPPVRPLRRRARLPAGLRHRRRARGRRRPPDRPAGGRGRRRRLPARRTGVRPLGAPAHRAARREGRPRPPYRHRRDRRPADRPRPSRACARSPSYAPGAAPS